MSLQYLAKKLEVQRISGSDDDNADGGGVAVLDVDVDEEPDQVTAQFLRIRRSNFKLE